MKIVIPLVFSFYIIALILFQPMQAESQSSSANNSTQTSFFTQLSKCFINRDMQPSYPTQMDSLIINNTIVTIFVEEITYSCALPQNLIVDVSFYIKLTDDLETQLPNERSLQAVTCIKSYDSTLSQCMSEQILLDDPSLDLRCSVPTGFQRPVAMNSVIGSNNNTQLIKNIKVDSKLFLCRDQSDTQLVKEVVTFTHTYGDIHTGVSVKSIESVTCLNNIVNLKILGCTVIKIM